MKQSKRKFSKNYTKGKGKLWKKGQCAVSNPECNKHRQAAKNRIMFGKPSTASTTSNLTVAQLEQHNRMTLDNEIEDDTMTIGKDTALTGFTNCSLPTFSRLLTNWNGSSFLHVKMRAALEAVAEIIKNAGEEESEAKYFSVLNVMLDDVDSDETLTAIICLLSMVVKKMNKSTLIGLQKTPILETFTKLLIKYMNSDHCALLRNLLSILYAFLRLRTTWPEKSNELNVILEFTTHHKPKVRRAAHYIIRSLLLNYLTENSSVHPQATNIANFCITKLENKSSDSKEVFYTLNLLQDILGLFPKPSIKKTCEVIIKVMTLSNSMATSSCLKALKGLFLTSSSETLTADLNAKIISAMYPYQPNLKEAQSLIDWLQLMEAAFISLYKFDEKLCISHLPNFFSNALKCWFSEREEVLQAVAITLNNLVQVCIDITRNAFQEFLFDDPVDNPMYKMFASVESALSYQYHKAWKYVILVLSSFFETMGKPCHTIMLKCLHSLGDLHDSYKFPCVKEAEKAIGIAIEHMGPQVVLSAIPLQISLEKPEFPRNWLLVLLKEHIQKTELGFFCKYFMNLATKLKNRAMMLAQEEKMSESSLFELLYIQMWSLLSGFCNQPTDLEKIFKEEEGSGKKGFPRILADALKFEPKLRILVLCAIRTLITKNTENEKHIETMQKFSNNYLPVLFNLYSPDSQDSVDEKVRLATYETIKVYLTITKKDVCGNLFKSAIEKLKTTSDNFKQAALLDIVRALLPYVDEDLVLELFEFSKPLLTHSNHTVQKKAYSVMKQICSCDSELCKKFVQTHKQEIHSLVSQALTSAPLATKALRLSCFESLLSQMTVEDINFIKTIITPQAVGAIKEYSVKSHQMAFKLIIEIGYTFKRLMPGNEKDALKIYIATLLSGGDGTPRFLSATVLAIGQVLFEFKDDISSDLINYLIENICTLLASPSREIVVAALAFLKTLLTTVDTVVLAQHVEFLIKKVTSLTEDNQKHFRFRAKEIFTRLIRKFGFEMIFKLVPEQFHKQLNHIRKLEARKARKRTMQSNNAESEDDDEGLEDSEDELSKGELSVEKETKIKKSRETFLEENDENDIVDFMDPSAINRIISKPTRKFSSAMVDVPSTDGLPKVETLEGFEIKEGRIVIPKEEPKIRKRKKQQEDTEMKEEVVEKESKKKEEEKEVKKEDDPHKLGDEVTFADIIFLKRKRKKRKQADLDDDEDKPEITSKTEQVETGIHRTLKPKAKKMRPGDQYKAKKAGGDLKKGNLDPYAYVPFNRQALNKRKQVKLKGQYKNIVKAAKKGAVIGLKKKARMAKKKKKNV